jgi:hypothetical protein
MTDTKRELDALRDRGDGDVLGVGFARASEDHPTNLAAVSAILFSASCYDAAANAGRFMTSPCGCRKLVRTS